MFSTSITLALLAMLLILALLWLGNSWLDYRFIRDELPANVRTTFRQYLVDSLYTARTRFGARWAERRKTWGRAAWWVGIALFGGIAIAAWIGGTQYVQSWAGTLFRACSGAALGFLVSRFLLRINVSDIAARYPAGTQQQATSASTALLASAIVVGAGVLGATLGI